jgi:positive regulator of sigma E activity
MWGSKVISFLSHVLFTSLFFLDLLIVVFVLCLFKYLVSYWENQHCNSLRGKKDKQLQILIRNLIDYQE